MKKFISYLFERSNTYVLFWTYIVSSMDNKNILSIDPKYICSRFNLSRRTFDRVMQYGCDFEGEFSLEQTYTDDRLQISLIKGKKKVSSKHTVKDTYYEQVMEIIEYFNTIVKQFGKNGLRGYNKSAATYIHKRLEEGFIVDNFKDVMDAKMEWLKDTEMHKFYRPSTLFSGKFEEYLNENVKPIKQTKKDIQNEQLSEALHRAATDTY